MGGKEKILGGMGQLLGPGTGKLLGKREVWNNVSLVVCVLILYNRHLLFRDIMCYTRENTMLCFSVASFKVKC